MQVFIARPNINLYPGIRVDKDTVIEFENEHVKQSLKDLVFRSITTRKGKGYESTVDTVIELEVGDILLFEEENRGYIKPVDGFTTIAEAIEDLESIKDIGGKTECTE